MVHFCSKLANVKELSLIYGTLPTIFIRRKTMEKIHEQETQLEHDPIIKEEISWKTAVAKVEIVLNDVCREYEKDGHPYYGDTLMKHWRRILKG